jgi:hypothetical protein
MFETGAFTREAVEVRRRGAAVAVRADVIGAKRVDGHEQEITSAQIQRAAAGHALRQIEAGGGIGARRLVVPGRWRSHQRGKLDCATRDRCSLQQDQTEVIEV